MGTPENFSTDKLYDVIVVGGGPAGLTDAIYLARARYRVLVIEQETFGGNITITSEVVNYPGIRKTSGTELTKAMKDQAEGFGAEFLLAKVTKLVMDGDVKTVYLEDDTLYCLGILIATGSQPRMVGFKGEKEFKGHGVAYCATCDGEFFTGKEIFVVGGGFAAAEESVFLTKFATHVTILIKDNDFSCATSVAEQAKNHEKITVLTNTVVEEVSGDNVPNYIRYKNTSTNQITEYRSAKDDFFGVFVFAGYEPANTLVKGLVQLNEQGNIVTDCNQKTNVPGLYAAGDVCTKPLRQIVTAVGDGALAATELEKYVAAMQRSTGLLPICPVIKHSANMSAALAASTTQNVSDTAETERRSSSYFTPDMQAQLENIFERMAASVVLKLYLDGSPLSAELEDYITSLAGLTDKLSVVTERATTPYVRICLADGTKTGLAFHGVPGGHEFTSFILGIYNVSGPGQPLDAALTDEIKAIHTPVDIKILVSLSCTMCPETVLSAQHIAALNSNVTAEAYDLKHFQVLKEQYNVMSVPCIIINDSKVSFGKKNIKQMLELIKEN